MNSSRKANGGLLPHNSALQHARESLRAPRPLPLFLELVRQVSDRDEEMARAALAGLRAYENAPRRERPPAKPEVARVAGAALRDHGGAGAPVVLIPSLINPPRILDLDEQVSLTAGLAQMGRRPHLLDWGTADERAGLSVTGHIEHLLLPLLRKIAEPPALIGYCLGGTMAIAAANLLAVEKVVTIASPWNFSAYPEASRRALEQMWDCSKGAARQLGALPMEVLQAAFWSLDPERTVRKFAHFGRLDMRSPDARRFVELEEWANEGEPLPYLAAKELIEDFVANDLPGEETWRVSGKTVSDDLPSPSLHFTAENDRIAPAATAPAGERIAVRSGHVGMIVGSTRNQLIEGLRSFLP